MKNKKMKGEKLENGKRAGALFWAGFFIALVGVISLMFVVSALTSTQQDELAQLESGFQLNQNNGWIK